MPRNVQTGPARVTASCAGAGRAMKRLIVIGQVLPPSVQVVKTGWSTRPYPFGGTGVSYGVILANQSTKRDALDVNVIVNFVMSDNRLIGSAGAHISDIAAGTQHAFGGEANFPGGAPIARLKGTAIMSPESARARSPLTNQCVKYTMIPGKKPASATPRKKRAR